MYTLNKEVHTHIAGQHDLALTAVERESELPLNDNAVIDGHGPMDG